MAAIISKPKQDRGTFVNLNVNVIFNRALKQRRRRRQRQRRRTIG